MHDTRSGFSFVQLVVVIGIITVVAGLTVASVDRVRYYSTLASCANNMRQVAQAGNLYRAQNAGEWPPNLFNEGYADFSYFEPFTSNKDIFRCPASGTPPIVGLDGVVRVEDFIYIGNLDGQVTDNDFNRGHGNSDPFDPGNPTTNAVLTWIFGRSTFDNYIIYDASPDHHQGTINVCWLRDAHVEQHSWDDVQSTLVGPAELTALHRLYTEGGSASGEILSDLDIPPGTVLPCLYCAGTGKVMNPNSGKLQNDAACGGAGTITY